MGQPAACGPGPSHTPVSVSTTKGARRGDGDAHRQRRTLRLALGALGQASPVPLRPDLSQRGSWGACCLVGNPPGGGSPWVKGTRAITIGRGHTGARVKAGVGVRTVKGSPPKASLPGQRTAPDMPAAQPLPSSAADLVAAQWVLDSRGTGGNQGSCGSQRRGCSAQVF